MWIQPTSHKSYIRIATYTRHFVRFKRQHILFIPEHKLECYYHYLCPSHIVKAVYRKRATRSAAFNLANASMSFQHFHPSIEPIKGQEIISNWTRSYYKRVYIPNVYCTQYWEAFYGTVQANRYHLHLQSEIRNCICLMKQRVGYIQSVVSCFWKWHFNGIIKPL